MEIKSLSCNPEIWGGIECTINRVGDLYRDQCAETGHYTRADDIAQIAATGICKLRYPVLWEKHTPDSHGSIDWNFTRLRLETLRIKNVTPIVGLLHHGSGPTHTNLLDHAFPEKLAAFAKAVATEFPWLKYYTPVNEPLTTARFSGLYGFWYPHHSNERSFILMLLNQLKGIVLSMQAIRTINPAAILVQTEDLCKVHSTAALEYQASFENERRWLTYDLLCGKFKHGHPLWQYFQSLDIPEDKLTFFTDNPCPPGIMGFNYYITSERYLDDNLQKYSPDLHGGNGHHRYVDTDAVRNNHRLGLAPLMEEAWNRYHLPMAVTECHLNCTREEQMRWLQETWDACILLNRKGIPVKAVTAWSLLGSFDWDNLLLQPNGHYESGVFDISNGKLRPTLLTELIQAFATGDLFYHPLLRNNGWWHRSSFINLTNTLSAPPLQLLHSSNFSPVMFETLCMDRKINQQALSFSTVLQGVDGYSKQSQTKLVPWGIIIIVTDSHNEAKDLLIDVRFIRQCENNNIPFMIYISAGASALVHELVVNEDTSCLIIVSDNTEDMKSGHRALDLFIDGQKGAWTIEDNRVHKINQREPALF